MSRPTQGPILILLGAYNLSGVPQMRLRLAGELAARGFAVEIVVLTGTEAADDSFPPDVAVTWLGCTRALTAVPRLVRALRRRVPLAVISAEDHANLAAIVSLAISRSRARLLVSMHARTWVYAAAWWHKEYWMARLIHFLYPLAYAVAAVSHGLASEVRERFDLPAGLVVALPNPAVVEGRQAPAAEHPWFGGEVPIVCACGRLSPDKGFDVLVESFAKLRKDRRCRLILIGAGVERDRLISLAERLGVAEDVDLIGERPNPVSFMRASDLFVSSSRREGFGNVLAEAIGAGTPVVATDCEHGPREILMDGKLGPLVAVDDAEGLAEAMAASLEHPLDSDMLVRGSRRYSVATSADGYLHALGLPKTAMVLSGSGASRALLRRDG